MRNPACSKARICEGCSGTMSGLIAACGDPRQGDRWWFVHTDGLYTSPDGGVTLNKFLDESGRQCGAAK